MIKYYFSASLFFLLLFAGTAHAQNNKETILDELFMNTGEICFTFNVTDKSEVDILTKIISIDNFRSHEVFAYANRNEFSRFLDYGYKYKVVPHQASLMTDEELNMGKISKDNKSRTIWNFYPTYQQYLDFMAGFASSYPDICRLDTIGTTNQGRLLLAVKISDSVNYERGVPQFMYTSSIHGDELTGFILMMHLIDSLLTGYNNVPRITDMIRNTKIYINPLANPDGTYHGGNNTVNGAWRYNSMAVDINRNYPDPADGPHPDGESWQTETQAFMAFAGNHHIVSSLNFHGGAEVFNYPWDTWSKLNADDAWWQLVAREYADTVHAFGPSNYFRDENNGITNGYAWYRITGGRQDYHTYFMHGRESTLEISNTKTPPASQLINFWNYNRRSFLNFIEQANFGINGQVTDTLTGEPLSAKVLIASHDFDSSWVHSYLPTGWYFRPINPGSWSLTFTSPGYFPKTISNVQVINRQTTRLNVKLIPLNIGGAENQIIRNYPLVSPNPSDGHIRLNIPENTGSDISVDFINSMGSVVFSDSFQSLTNTFIPLDLSRFPGGIYLVRLNTGKFVYEGKMVIK